MALADETAEYLYALTDTSGTTVTAAVGTNGTIAGGAEDTGFSWINGANTLLDALDFLIGSGAGQSYVTIGGTQSSTKAHKFFAARFSLDALVSGNNYLKGRRSDNFSANGGIDLYATAPAGSGDYDLVLRYTDIGGNGASHTFSALSFGVTYGVAGTWNVTSNGASAGLFRAAISTGTELSGTFGNFGSTLPTNFGYLNRQHNSAVLNGWNGKIFGVAEFRGYYATAAEVLASAENISTLPDWPGGVVSLGPELTSVTGTVRDGGSITLNGTGLDLVETVTLRDTTLAHSHAQTITSQDATSIVLTVDKGDVPLTDANWTIEFLVDDGASGTDTLTVTLTTSSGWALTTTTGTQMEAGDGTSLHDWISGTAAAGEQFHYQVITDGDAVAATHTVTVLADGSFSVDGGTGLDMFGIEHWDATDGWSAATIRLGDGAADFGTAVAESALDLGFDLTI